MTFRDVTTGFPTKWCQWGAHGAEISYWCQLCHCPDLGSAFDWSRFSLKHDQSGALRSSQNHKRDAIGVRRIRTFPSLTFRLWSGENQIVGVGSRNGRIKQSQYTFPRFVIGFVLLLLLPTPTIRFLLDHKRNVSDGIVSGIGTLFSLDHKLYASDYYSDSDSDSVASENQPLIWTLLHCKK